MRNTRYEAQGDARRGRPVRETARRAAARITGAGRARALREEPYGYTLRTSLEAAGLPIDEGALYPLLRRLEAQGLLTSEWREEAKRNKRFYRLTPNGLHVLGQLLAEWNAISESILRLTEGEK